MAAPIQTGMLPPYGGLRNRLAAGTLIPFLGAGVHLSSRPEKAAYTEIGHDFLPSGSELAACLATDAGIANQLGPCDGSDLAKMASYYVRSLGRGDLDETLRRVFNASYGFHPQYDIHRHLARNATPLLVVSTNYDDLMERALRELEKPYYVVVQLPSDRNAVLVWKPGVVVPDVLHPQEQLIPDFDAHWVIYKMHGSALRGTDERAEEIKRAGKAPKDYESFLITEEDYFDFLSHMTESQLIPAQIMERFGDRRFLFLGYGLRDWNLRVILHNLQRVLHRSWAFQPNPSPVESKVWEKRGVDMFDRSIVQFVQEMWP